MQFPSPSSLSLLAALIPAEQMAKVQTLTGPLTQLLQENAATLALLFGLSQVAAILSYWAASKIVSQEEGRFVNALRTYAFYILFSILIVSGGAGSIYAVETMAGSSLPVSPHLIAAGLAILFAVLLVVSVFAVPMKVFKIGVPQSIGFVAIVFVLQFAAGLGLNKTVGRNLTAKDSPFPAALLKLAQSATTGAPEAAPKPPPDADSDEQVAADKTKSIAERQAALKDLYNRLESMYQALPPGQSISRADYDTRKARYERLLADLRSDAARSKQ